MPAIERKKRTVFYAPTANRSFFTAASAASREAAAMIARKYPSERTEHDDFGRVTYGGWNWHEEERLCRVHTRLTARIRAALKAHGASHDA